MTIDAVNNIVSKSRENYDKMSIGEKSEMLLRALALFFETPEPAKFVVALGIGKIMEFESEIINKMTNER